MFFIVGNAGFISSTEVGRTTTGYKPQGARVQVEAAESEP